MRTKFILFSFSFLMSCNNDDLSESLQSGGYGNDFSTTVIDCIEKYINITRGTDDTRASSDSYEITPYIINGDTALYVVNYDSGWQIFSNSFKAPLVLAFSETGNLDINDEVFKDSPLSSYIESLVSGVSLLDRSLVRFPKDSLGFNQLDTTQATIYPEPYLENIDTLSILEKNHLIQTKWGNKSPWNRYVKLAPNGSGSMEHAQVGCGAVAVGQYLFYKQHNGYSNLEAMSNAVYDSINNEYAFSNPSSSIWGKMAMTYVEANENPYLGDSAAVFLGDISKSISTFFAVEGTGSTATTQKNYLNSCGFNFVYSAIDYDYIIDQLANNEPVVIQIQSPVGGHACLVDGYRIENFRATFHMITMGGVSQTVYRDYSIRYICMNWGWDGVSDEVWLVASNDAEWNVVYYKEQLNNPNPNPISFPSNYSRTMLKHSN